jgi:hypothetical protein
MPGRPKDRRHFRFASGPQLWRLNTLGRLRLVDDAPPISSNEAKVLISAEFGRLGWATSRRVSETDSGAEQGAFRADP